jgi:hypothetical protein
MQFRVVEVDSPLQQPHLTRSQQEEAKYDIVISASPSVSLQQKLWQAAILYKGGLQIYDTVRHRANFVSTICMSQYSTVYMCYATALLV